jgi:hypothetical protein
MKKQKSNLALNKPTDRAYLRIKEILDAARSNTYRAVNFAMVQAYWSIGRVIVEEEQKGKLQLKILNLKPLKLLNKKK